jgi:hypothetical protein
MDSRFQGAERAGIRTRASWHFTALVVIGGTVLAACSSNSSGGTGPTPGLAAALAMAIQPGVTAPNRTVLSPGPAIQVVDGNGAVVDTLGIPVTVAVQSGGGSLTGTTTVLTNASGVATFSDLQIAGTVGNRVLRFTSGTLTGVNSSTVLLTAGPAVAISAASSVTQNGTISQAVTSKPAVKVTDQDGNGVGGVGITFAVTAGGGSGTGLSQSTDVAGIATVGGWTLGASPGYNEMSATSGSLTGSPLLFSASAGSVTSAFNIELQYINTPDPAQAAAFLRAASRWSQVITGDLGAVNVTPAVDVSVCGAPAGTTTGGIINDVRIIVELKPYDGVGKVLGAATPCYIRNSSMLTLIGYMFFDTADLANLEASGDLDDVILHEMGHVLGFGTFWENRTVAPTTFLTTSGTINGSTLGFNGGNALSAFTGSNGGAGTAVPVEDTTVAGTGRAHWREPVFLSELMTGYLSGTVHPLSLTTVQSMADLGYTVNPAAADAFNLATQPTLRANQAAGPVVHLENDIIRVPKRYIDVATGRVIPGGTH